MNEFSSASENRKFHPGQLRYVSRRKEMVVAGIAAGMTMHALARRLNVAESTIRTHLFNLYRRFDIRTQAEAVVFAYEIGMLVPAYLEPWVKKGGGGVGLHDLLHRQDELSPATCPSCGWKFGQETPGGLVDVLNSAERKTAYWVTATGWCNQEIACRLCISVDTVKTHLRNIYRKLNLCGRNTLVSFGYENGLVVPAYALKPSYPRQQHRAGTAHASSRPLLHRTAVISAAEIPKTPSNPGQAAPLFRDGRFT